MKRTLKTILYFIIISSFSFISFSQPLRRTDLSNLHVNAFAQDSLGYIWIATANGLCKSYGNSYSVFFYNERNKNSIPSNNITGLYVDKNSKLWISTGNGICSMSKSRYEFQRYLKNNSAGSEGFFLGFIEYAGKILTYGYNGLYEIDEKNKCLIPRLKIDRQVIYGALQDKQKNLWITNGIELIKLNQSLSFVSKVTVDKGANVNCMINYGNDILLGTENGIKLFNLNSFKIVDSNFSKSLSDLRINQLLLIDGGHRLLINTNNKGVLVYNFKTRELKTSDNNIEFNDIPSIDITSAFVDKEKNIWIGTFDHGHFMLSNRKKIFNKDKGLVNLFRNKFVTRIIGDRFGNMWIGTRYDGFIYYNTKNKKVIKYNDSTTSWLSVFNSNFVQEIYCDSKNRLWIGYGNLLIVCKASQDGRIILEKTYSGIGNVVTITEDGNKRIWAGSSDNGLYIYNEDLTLKKHITSAVSNSNNITKIISLSNDNMLFSAYMDNIYIIDDNTLVANALNSKFQNNWSNTVDLKLDTRNNLWIGTYGNGLMKYNLKEKTLKQYSELQRKDIVGIEYDKQHNIWASSSNGIYRISSSTNAINIYLEQDGTGGNQYHEKCAFKDASGHIYFGGNTGLEEITPENVESAKQNNPIYLTDLKLFGNSVVPKDGGIVDKDISLTKKIKLKHNENVVSLEFTSISYDCLSLLEYAYMLDGFDQTWNYIGKYNRATYSNLPAGHYTFMVKVKNGNGVWEAPRKLLDVVVKPAPWLHPIALSIYAALLILLIILLNRLYIRFKLAKERITLTEAKIAHEHKMSEMKVNFFTNISHELRTPLTLIYAPVKMLREKYQSLNEQQLAYNLDFIANNVDRLMNLTDQLLKFRNIKNETLPLKVGYHDCVQQLSNIVKLYNIYTAEKNLSMEFDCSYESLTVMYDSDKLDKIMNNLFMNATKYSLDSGSIVVTLDLVKHPENIDNENEWAYIEIRVSDTGIGIDKNDFSRLFKRFSRLVNPSKRDQINGFGIGLNFVYHLVDNHKGKIRAEQNTTKGMTFIVDIPVSEDAYSENERATDHTDIKQSGEITDHDESVVATSNPGNIADKKISKTERKKILVVEDNPDMNTFIAGLFSDTFDVTTALDGLNGLQRAIEIVPDVIICDVLMPRMDGFEVCGKIKEDKDICHIPVILLTAKNMDEDQIKGYNCGADMYVSKPFNPNVLISIVNRMIAKQEMQQALLRSTCGIKNSVPIEEDAQFELSPLDQKFLNKLYKYIEDNISNNEINVNLLGQELGYSRTNFYRKVKALTNVTPNDLLKTYRLNRAAELILRREYTLGEISEMTGFGIQSHFSSSFKKHFGVSPKDYLSDHFNK
ncbi:MAG: two-component regulator propeller domain-containing protein [Paludibacter sp.]|nr:two-component regulator propeller domain-containing protein [Paludibacter sp.]